jgi:hypothetical protein
VIGSSRRQERPALSLVERHLDQAVDWAWFCGHCAAPSPGGVAPAANRRVCGTCGLGVLLATRPDARPGRHDAFLVIDSRLTVQAMSRRAERFLALPEECAVNRPVSELLVSADAEANGVDGFVAAITRATGGDDTAHFVSLRPRNTFGVRLRAGVAPCGPPRAALVTFEVAGAGQARPAGTTT